MPKIKNSDNIEQSLLQAARNAKASSYSPYSKFRVGAAVLIEGDEVVQGANIENASYSLTCCAERVALFAALVKCAGDRSKLKAIAISCGDDPDLPKNSLVPCGSCRQVMVELLRPRAAVFIDGLKPSTVGELLPIPFSLDEYYK